MSPDLLSVGLVGAGVVFLIGAAVLTIVAARIASAGRIAKAEADIRLAASQELAGEVKRLAEKVEASLAARDASIENAFMRHNDACAASMQAQMGAQSGTPAKASGGHHDDDDDDDHHKKHHAAFSGHDDDDDDDHHKHHAADGERPSLLARLFGRY